MGDLADRIACALRGHVPATPELLDVVPETGDAVVATTCLRCGREFLGVIQKGGLAAARAEGPWDAQPCLICEKPTLQSQNHVPEMWPCAAVCPDCAPAWDNL